MRALLLLLLSLVGTVTGAELAIVPPDFSECGKGGDDLRYIMTYLECHVDADCLYGKREGRVEKMFLRRYFKAFHGEKNLANCATVIVANSTPPEPENRHQHDEFHMHKVREFKAGGWIDPAHFRTGVRFLVGQKIVALSEDDGFTDDDDWVYRNKLGAFPIFNGTFNWKKEADGKIHVALEAKAHDDFRQAHYVIPYSPGQPKGATITPEPLFLFPRKQDSNASQLVASVVSHALEAAPATSQSPVFPIVMGVIGAITLAGVGYMLVQRKRRNAPGAGNAYAQLPVHDGRRE